MSQEQVISNLVMAAAAPPPPPPPPPKGGVLARLRGRAPRHQNALNRNDSSTLCLSVRHDNNPVSRRCAPSHVAMGS